MSDIHGIGGRVPQETSSTACGVMSTRRGNYGISKDTRNAYEDGNNDL